MLRLLDISKSYGDSIVLNKVSLTLAPGQKIGVIGPNGCGKSTLLKIIAQELDADGGQVLGREVKIGYLRQFIDSEFEPLTVGSYLVPEAFQAMEHVHRLETLMTNVAQAQALQSEYEQAFEDFDGKGGWQLENRIEQVLHGLSMPDVTLNRALKSLSGGQRTRLALARVLLLNAQILLLDEPTNNLDAASIAWLEASLSEAKAGCLIVSHDRRFLDAVTTRTFEIDASTHQLRQYGGNFSWYMVRKAEDEERQRREYKEQQERISKLKSDIRATKDQAMSTEKSTHDDRLRRYAKKVAAKAKARETRLARMISAEHKIEKPRKLERIRMSFSGHELYNRILLQSKNVYLSYDHNRILNDVNLFMRGSARIGLTGPNGSGKSTLLRVILGEIVPQSGEMKLQENLRICYLPQCQASLPCDKTILDYFLEEARTATKYSELLDCGKARTFLHRFLFSGDQVFQTVGALSQGERVKLVFATFMAINPDLLILDEPTSHLDIASLNCLESALKSFAGALIVVSHDRFFMEQLALDINWTMKNGTVECTSA